MSTYKPWATLLPINSGAAPYGDGVTGVVFPFAYDYTWIWGVGLVMSFMCAAGIGANDVANAFATSVGSGSVSFIQAMVIAAIFEFSGSVLLGATVADTVAKKVISVSTFQATATRQDNSDLLMIGMLCALFATTFWLYLATFLELAVSTTHSIIGAIVGFGLCLPFAAIGWSVVVDIVISWFASPLIAAAMSALFFFSARGLILRSPNSFNRTILFFPFLILFVVAINVWFIILKGGASYGWAKQVGGTWGSLGVGAACGAGVAIIVQLTLVPRIRRTLTNVTEPADANKYNVESGSKEGEAVNEGDLQIQDQPKDKATGGATVQDGAAAKGPGSLAASMASWSESKNEKVHKISNDTVQAIHDRAEKFEYRTELAFGYLQVFTACAMSFAHGANDVSNAVGPFATINYVYNNNGTASKATLPVWILVMGGAGIVVGLAVYGHKVVRALGVKLIKITPARGACIELATALVVVIGTILGLPLSTTHTVVGASLGVGLLEGGLQCTKTINQKLMFKTFFAWIITLVVAGCTSALLFSFTIYSPSLSRPMSPQNCMWYGQRVVNAATTIFINNGTADVAYQVPANATVFIGSRVGFGSFPVSNKAVINLPSV
jgi:sodium-dependent phosphate transporter